MTLYKYDDHIKKWQEEYKMKDMILLDFFELSLKEIDLYIDTLQQICNIPLLTNYLKDYVLSIVADWPNQ
ncbi:21007_t:CDS:1, partial [Racocetra persica]